MAVCIIPARGGRNRIPRKNLAPFHGRPMIGWASEAAKATGLFDRVVVSTDDVEIAETALKEGAEIPFLRPEALADDYTPTVPVIAHAVTALALVPETQVCCLYATAPLVRPNDLRAGYALLDGPEYVMSITSFPSSIGQGPPHGQRACRSLAKAPKGCSYRDTGFKTSTRSKTGPAPRHCLP